MSNHEGEFPGIGLCDAHQEMLTRQLSDEGLIELEWSWGRRWAKITAKGRSTLRRG